MKLSTMALNAITDPTYCPYCLRCPGIARMEQVEPFYWRHKCGAEHDERANVAAALAEANKDHPQ